MVTDDEGTRRGRDGCRGNGEITDVRSKTTLDDYTGELQGDAIWRFTDRNNAVAPGGGTDAATMIDIPVPIDMTCAATANPAVGGTCSVNSSFNALVPGAVSFGHRAVVGMEQVLVNDGGSDGVSGTLPQHPLRGPGHLRSLTPRQRPSPVASGLRSSFGHENWATLGPRSTR